MQDRLVSAAASCSRAVRAICTPATLQGTAVEVAWWAAHLALYPSGVLAEKVGRAGAGEYTSLQRALLERHLDAAGTPILLVHGVVDNRSVFALLRRALHRRGFSEVRTLNYSPFTHDVRIAARQLGEAVERVCEETGHDRLHVVGHSLGGLIARYYVQRQGGDERVHTLVTLGTPHSGTRAAWLLPTPVLWQLRPGSSLLRELAEPAAGCRTRFLALWSDLDQMMVPKTCARLEHPDLDAENVPVQGVGHLSLPISGDVVRHVVRTLVHRGPVAAADGPARPATTATTSPGPALAPVVGAPRPGSPRPGSPRTRRGGAGPGTSGPGSSGLTGTTLVGATSD